MASLSKVNIGAIVSRVSSAISDSPAVYKGKQVACDAAYVTKKLLKSTGNAAWITGTTFVVLLVPLIIQMELDAPYIEHELQLSSLYGNSAPFSVPK